MQLTQGFGFEQQPRQRVLARTIELVTLLEQPLPTLATTLLDIFTVDAYFPEEIRNELRVISNAPEGSALRCDVAAREMPGERMMVWTDHRFPEFFSDLITYVLHGVEPPSIRNYLSTTKLHRDLREFLKLLANRREIIQKTVTAVCEYQRDYLTKRRQHVLPLLRQQIADITGMELSVVCRAVMGKWIEYGEDTLEISALFSRPVPGAADSDLSRDAVLGMVREILNGDPGRILSDQDIQESLRHKGVDIARRTIAKYRSDLGFGGSRRNGEPGGGFRRLGLIGSDLNEKVVQFLSMSSNGRGRDVWLAQLSFFFGRHTIATVEDLVALAPEALEHYADGLGAVERSPERVGEHVRVIRTFLAWATGKGAKWGEASPPDSEELGPVPVSSVESGYRRDEGTGSREELVGEAPRAEEAEQGAGSQGLAMELNDFIEGRETESREVIHEDTPSVPPPPPSMEREAEEPTEAPTILGLIDGFLGTMGEHSRSDYRSVLQDFCVRCAIRSSRALVRTMPSDVATYRSILETNGTSESERARRNSVLWVFFQWLGKKGYVADNPVQSAR